MAIIKYNSSGRHIRSLLLVQGSGIAAALLFSLAMLHYYNPSGSYLAKNVLLSPENALSIHYKEGKESAPFVFDAIEFSYFDPEKKLWQRLQVDIGKYREFYALVGNDESLSDVSETTRGLFVQSHPATLTVHVHSESKGASSHPFLQVNFVEAGSVYRIQLRQQHPEDDWAYFYHPDIYQKLIKIFKET